MLLLCAGAFLRLKTLLQYFSVAATADIVAV